MCRGHTTNRCLAGAFLNQARQTTKSTDKSWVLDWILIIELIHNLRPNYL